MLLIYRLLINLTIILSPLIIAIRLIKKKEHPSRFKEKFCFFTRKRVPGKLVWFHGASVGEILSVIPLIEKLEKNQQIKQILITSSTLSSANVISKFSFKKTTHQFFPIDSNYFVKKFINYWKPSLVIFIDSEIWPNMLINLKKKSINHILLNARLTKKSYKRWLRIKYFSKNLFENFNAVYPQNKETKKYLKNLGCIKIKELGNLKYVVSDLKADLNLKNKINELKNKRKIWCASSTHNSEEMICAQAHLKLKNKYKNLLTIIIPRHIQRKNDIFSSIKKIGLNVHCHSSRKKITDNTDIYLVDTYGETKNFFKICSVVFLGGSIIKHGGQNPLEAARYGNKILHGKNVENFKEIYHLLKKNNQTIKVKNYKQISNAIDKLFKNKSNSNLLAKKIKKMGDKILTKTENEINNFIS
jgi:3-deoxy-D-manno-octulosonic-acid transferase